MTPKKIIFEPGCFDSFDGTKEELEELMVEITRMFESGEYLENSVPISQEE